MSNDNTIRIMKNREMRVSWQLLQQLPARHWKNGITWQPTLQKISEPRFEYYYSILPKIKVILILLKLFFFWDGAWARFQPKNCGIFN